ncbi:MAG: hypothetical protein AB7F09_03110 [Parvibaculaceae bacterium]
MAAYDWQCVTPLRAATFLVICIALAACSTADSPKLDDAVAPVPAALLPAGTLTGIQTVQALSDRSFNFLQDGIKGAITFHSDGTLSYRAAIAGKGTGVWQASDGGLCQTLNPTNFLPRGTRTICYALVSTGQEYRWGRAHYTPV